MDNNVIKVKTTTMSVEVPTLAKLRAYKVHPRETDNQVLGRMLAKLPAE